MTGHGCPNCDEEGKRVSLKVVSRVLNRPLEPEETAGYFYACTSPYCFAAYYKSDGTVFPIHEAKVPFSFKAFYSNPIVCHCNGVRLETIKDAIRVKKAYTLKEVTECTGAMNVRRCDQMNPLGQCCQEEIQRLIDLYKE